MSFVLLLLLIYSFFVFSRDGIDSYMQTLTGPQYIEGTSMAVTDDGGYVITGNFDDEKQLLLVKYSINGTFEWGKRFGIGGMSIFGKYILQTSDGGYVVAGERGSYNAGTEEDVFLAKFSSDGSQEWASKLSDTRRDYVRSVVQTQDGGYLVLGFTEVSDWSTCVLLVKFTSTGTKSWVKSYGDGDIDEEGYSVKETADGDFIVCGKTRSFGPTLGSAILLAKFDSSGDQIWANAVGLGLYNAGYGLDLTSDGGMVVTGYVYGLTGSLKQLALLRYNATGHLLWATGFHGASSDEGGSVIQSMDGGFMLLGKTSSFTAGGNSDLIAIKYNAHGEFTSAKHLPSAKAFAWEYVGQVVQFEDESFGVVGYTWKSSARLIHISMLNRRGEGCGWTDIPTAFPGAYHVENCSGIVQEWDSTFPVQDRTSFFTYTDFDFAYYGFQDLTVEDNVEMRCEQVNSCYGVEGTDVELICSGHGACLAEDECVCDPGYRSKFCNLTTCFGVLSNDTSSCNGEQGRCAALDDCECAPGYYGSNCSLTTCFGEVRNASNDITNVCSGHGDCDVTEACRCDAAYFGGLCNVTSCYGHWNNATSDPPCHGRGDCAVLDKCRCDPGYYGDVCKITSCFGVMSNETNDPFCSMRGECVAFDRCACEENYFGPLCNITTCASHFSNLSATCGSHGVCVTLDHCHCTSKWHGDACNVSECFGVAANESEVCGGHGVCDQWSRCRCTDDWYGENCNFTKCYGIIGNESWVCDGHGECVLPNQCSCFENYTHAVGGQKDCSDFRCFGVWKNETGVVCTGHGECTGHDLCDCEALYDASEQCDWKCGPIDRWKSLLVCNGHGTCVDKDDCRCSSHDYVGALCSIWTCGNVSAQDAAVCGGHGTCTTLNQCQCQTGYSDGIGTCDSYKCFGVHKDVRTSVCSARGVCIAYDVCECAPYEGDDCETWSCSGIDYKDENVCSGSGDCVGPDRCDCQGGFEGEQCETNTLYATVLAPVLSVGASFFLGFVGLVFCATCCLFCTCLVCLVCAGGIGGVVFSSVVATQKFRMKKFEKLKNVDLLLKEQELDDDESIAHVRINKKLFEVPVDEIKIEKILGEGGSNSTVYRASWRGQQIAYKCFKTRTVCGTQSDFDEFEREVTVLASVAHPSIIRYFGACLNPPRVGILMEYCERGDLNVFLRRYESSDELDTLRYPFQEKLRMLLEISSAMEYLHARSIIHRDLKLENVLVTKEYTTKLMDFGLSKIVDKMSQMKTTRIGTAAYMAPEIVNSTVYTEKCDVYSFGILVFIMMTENHNPYEKGIMNVELRAAQDPNFRPMLEKLDGPENEIPPGSVEFLKDLCPRLWDHKPENRPSYDEVRELLGKEQNALTGGGDSTEGGTKVNVLDQIFGNHEPAESDETETEETEDVVEEEPEVNVLDQIFGRAEPDEKIESTEEEEVEDRNVGGEEEEQAESLEDMKEKYQRLLENVKRKDKKYQRLLENVKRFCESENRNVDTFLE